MDSCTGGGLGEDGLEERGGSAEEEVEERGQAQKKPQDWVRRGLLWW